MPIFPANPKENKTPPLHSRLDKKNPVKIMTQFSKIMQHSYSPARTADPDEDFFH
jgi:hypothetical protein